MQKRLLELRKALRKYCVMCRFYSDYDNEREDNKSKH
jgi:hypothetical protein